MGVEQVPLVISLGLGLGKALGAADGSVSAGMMRVDGHSFDRLCVPEQVWDPFSRLRVSGESSM